MDFTWNADQLQLKEDIIEFARTELNSEVLQHDQGATFPREKWNKCAEFGLPGLALPKEYGGRGADVLSVTLAMEGLGYGCRDNGLAFTVNGQMFIQLPLVHFGTDEQKRRFLPGMCAGEIIGAFGFTESDAGSDLYSLSTRAEKRDDGYVLNGRKKFVSFAPIAGFALVLATTDPQKGKWGLTVFLVDTSMAGVEVREARDKLGLRTVPMSDLIMRDCFVPMKNRLGIEGGGVNIVNQSLEWERCYSLASQVGAMQRLLEDCVDRAKKRQQFGQPIGQFQSVSNRIADMQVRLAAARHLLYEVAWLKHCGKNALMQAAITKLFISESFVQSSLDAIRIHGGDGYVTEVGVERYLRDATGSILYGGTSDIQRNIIAKMLGL